MKKSILTIILIVLANLIFAQSTFHQYDKNNLLRQKEPVRVINDNGLQGITIEYNFTGVNLTPVTVNGVNYTKFYIKDFSHLKTIGKPALPSHNDIIAIPEGATAQIEIISYDKVEIDNKLVFPALAPASDEVGAPEPEFVIDEQFYQTNTTYPAKIVKIDKINKYRNIQLATVKICPVQYNPYLKKVYAYTNIKYKITFSGATQFFDMSQHSANALRMIPDMMLNNKFIAAEINQYLSSNTRGVNGPSKNYIIITHDDYKAAADSLAQWKRQLGYSVEVVSRSSWTYTDIESEIHQRYQNWTPKPDYVVMIGDHDKVPGKIISSSATFASDLYTVCMNGSGDYYPDMAKGRISVASATQAMSVVKKIIDYEKTPPTLSSFYTNAVNCAYFQESSTTGYAERRFAQTSEDIRDYTNDVLGYNVSRIYATGSSVNPTNWNDGTYSAGEALPSYLLKPGFAWDGDYNDINNTINSGVFYVFHRDHGDVQLWGDPYYTTTYMNSLSNGNLTPVVFSINCLTGKFLDTECFSEKFLRYDNGGAVGVFCHAEVSYSGYNDGLALGLVDAIWSNPGLVPNFTGSGGVSNPTLTPHSDIFTMGDVANQGLLRMVETWGDNEYTHQLFHYFGDPAMKIWTQEPTQVTATHQTTIDCNDNTFTINSCSLDDGLATLVIDGMLVGEVQLSGGTGTINIPIQLYGNYAWLTISKHNYQPYVAKIPITGNCINASFTFTPNSSCLGGDDIVFTDNSGGPISSYNWDFGTDATPATATTVGPHTVSYSSAGWKYITLTAYSSTDTSIYIDSLYIDAICSYNMPSSGSQTLTGCSGVLYDNGGQGDYTTNFDATTVISTGASQIDLSFSVFNIEAGSGSTCDYDWIEIYDGPNTSSPLIGRYCNTTGSPGNITTSGGDVTIVMHSDQSVVYDGFEMTWQCIYANQPPVANFTASDTSSCSATIDFTDLSTNAPTAWTWYFGDGTTSTQQNPTHSYSTNGTFNVKLVCSNTYGADSLVKTSYITINSPSAPIAIDATRCTPGQLIVGATGSSGTINWYDSQTSTTLLDTGNTYTTPYLSNSTVYYAEEVVTGPTVYGGNSENNVNGSFYTAAYQHGIYFDCFNDITLVSVEVNANSAGNRTIELQDTNGTVIDQRTINIPSGISRINLDFDIQAGTHYKLAGPVSPDLYRNNAGCNYPYAVGSDVSITGSDASSATSYYYYFYNWEIVTGKCVSGRTAVNANIVIPNNITLTTSGSTSVCSGDTVTITAPAGATSYLWYPTSETTQSISVSTAGDYYVVYTIDSCSEYSDTVSITILNNNPIADFSYSSTGSTVNFSNLSQYGNTYLWDFGDGNTSTQQNPANTYAANGTYTVTLIVYNSCGSDTATQTVDVTSVGVLTNNVNNITIYPNPAKTNITIQTNGLKVNTYDIYDVYGQIVMQNNVNTNVVNIDVKNLKKGIYFIKLNTDNESVINKFVKN